jgi:hypothetical protein
MTTAETLKQEMRHDIEETGRALGFRGRITFKRGGGEDVPALQCRPADEMP